MNMEWLHTVDIENVLIVDDHPDDVELCAGGLMLKNQKMYRRASEAMLSLKPAVDAAIGRALEPRPEDRWPSATSFVDALARALA